MIKKLGVVGSLVCAAVLSFSGVCGATPLLPPLSPTVAGESKLVAPDNQYVYVDWLVYAPGTNVSWMGNNYNTGSNYLYVYQLENTSNETLERFTVKTPANTVNGVGYLNGYDLDNVHNAANFSNLAGEHEMANASIHNVASGDHDSSKVGWTFSTGYLAPGQESAAMYFTSTYAPTYNRLNGINSITFTKLELTGDFGPSPTVPEPSTMLLLGSGLSGLFTLGSLKKRKLNLKKADA